MTKPTFTLEQTTKRIEAATAAHERAKATLAAAHERKSDALTFGESPAALSKARQTVAECERAEAERREELEAAQALHAAALKAQADKLEAERITNRDAALVAHIGKVHDVQRKLEELVAAVQAVNAAQDAIKSHLPECIPGRNEGNIVVDLNAGNAKLGEIIGTAINRALVNCIRIERDLPDDQMQWAEHFRGLTACAEADAAQSEPTADEAAA
jgi:hypothetical protein